MYLLKKSLFASKRFMAGLCMLAVLFSCLYIPPVAAEAGGNVDPATNFTIKSGDGTELKTYDSIAALESKFSAEGKVIQQNYSAIDSTPTTTIVHCQGVSLKDIVESVGIDPTKVSQIVLVPTDTTAQVNHNKTLANPFSPSSLGNYYPGIMSNSTDGAQAVEPILSFRSYEDQSTAVDTTKYTTDTVMRLLVGQAAIDDHNKSNCTRGVKEIQITQAAPHGIQSADIITSAITYGSTISATIKTAGMTSMTVAVKSADDKTVVTSSAITGLDTAPNYSYTYQLPSDIVAGDYNLVVSGDGVDTVKTPFTVADPKGLTIDGDGITSKSYTYQQLKALGTVQRNYSTVNDNANERKLYATEGVDLTTLLSSAGIKIADVAKITVTPTDVDHKDPVDFLASDLLATRYFYPTLGSDDGKQPVAPMIALTENYGTAFTGMYAKNAPRFFIGQTSSAIGDKTGDRCLKWVKEIKVSLKAPKSPIIITSPATGDITGPGGKIYIEGTADKLTTVSAIVTGPDGSNTKVFESPSAIVSAGAFSIKAQLPDDLAKGTYTVSVNGTGMASPVTVTFKVVVVDEIAFTVNNNYVDPISVADLNNASKFTQHNITYSTPDCVDPPAPAVMMETKGVLLKDIVKQVLATKGFNNYDSIRFTAVDNYGRTWAKKDLVDTPRYFYPNYKVRVAGGTSAGAILVEPSIAMTERWLSEDNKDSASLPMTPAVAPRLYMGETAYGQQTTGFHIKSINKIDIMGARLDAVAGGNSASGAAITVSGAANIAAGSRLLINPDALAITNNGKIKVAGSDKDLTAFNVSGSAIDLTKNQTVGDKGVLVGKAVQLNSGGTSDLTLSAVGSSVAATIPNNTTVLAPLGWDGTINPPVLTGSAIGTAPAGFKIGNTTIEVGNPDQVLLFDKPVTITLPGVTGTNFAYKATGSTQWQKMNPAEGTYANPTAPAFPGEAYITDGTNTKIITWHMTQFANLTTNSVTPSSSGGGGGGGGSSSATTDGTATLTPSTGGTVTLSGCAALKVPANALTGSSSVALTIAKSNSVSATPDNMQKLGDAYSVTVGSDAAYAFAKPATLTVTFKTADLPTGSALSVFAYDSKTAKWSKVDSSVSGSTISADVSNGGVFGLFYDKTAAAATPTPVINSTIASAFSDIGSHWAKDAIEKMAGSGIVSGYSDGSFKPNKVVTRAEFAAMLVKVNNLPVASGKVFKDTANSWAKDYISTAYAAGIVKGLSDTYFGADQPITREQMAVMVDKVAQLKATDAKVSFTDAKKISKWSKEYLTIAVQNDLMKGYPDGSINPQGKTTRAEAVSVLSKIVK